MKSLASQITSVTIIYSTVYSGADQKKHQNSALLAFVREIRWSSVNSPQKRPVTRKKFPFDDIIMIIRDWSPMIRQSDDCARACEVVFRTL